MTGDLTTDEAGAVRSERLSATGRTVTSGPPSASTVAAIASFERAGFLADILGCSLGLADIQVAQGRLGAAERTLAAGLDLGTTKGPLRSTADMHVGLGELHFERNDLDAVAEQLQASLDVGDRLARKAEEVLR